jgi:hypothetical protein
MKKRGADVEIGWNLWATLPISCPSERPAQTP